MAAATATRTETSELGVLASVIAEAVAQIPSTANFVLCRWLDRRLLINDGYKRRLLTTAINDGYKELEASHNTKDHNSVEANNGYSLLGAVG